MGDREKGRRGEREIQNYRPGAGAFLARRGHRSVSLSPFLPFSPSRLLPFSLSSTLILLVALAPAALAAEPPGAPKEWVVLVAVGTHDDKSVLSLKTTANDVRTLRKILMERGGVPEERILELSDNVDKNSSRSPMAPTLKNLCEELPKFIKQVGPDDRLLIHFSCHGDRYPSAAITDASNAGPITISTDGPHHFESGDNVSIWDVRGNTSANGAWTIEVKSPTSFTLRGSAGNGAYVGRTGSAGLVNGMYIIPKDVSTRTYPEDLKKTALPSAKLTQWLNDCPAKEKFLVLDCCHAGGAKGGPVVGGRAVYVEGKDVPGTIVLAACKEKELSWEWGERNQGVFSYWFCRGLQGGADREGDGKITFADLYSYVYKHVVRTSKQLPGAEEQTPVFKSVDVPGIPVVINLQPETQQELYKRLAEDLDVEIRESKLKQVGICDFTAPLQEKELEGGLPARCAARLHTNLEKLQKNAAYGIVSSDEIMAAARRLGIEPRDLGEAKNVRKLRKEFPDLGAVICGSLSMREQNVYVRCKFVSADSDAVNLGGLFTDLSNSIVERKPNEVFELADGVKLVMKRIPATGKQFWMGSPDNEAKDAKDEWRKDPANSDYTEELHQVKFTHDYYLGEWKVTQAQYRAIMGQNPSWFSKTGAGKEQIRGMNTDDFPVENVSWEKAKDFCQRLNDKFQDRGYRFRLPTEAEWEFACRGGQTDKNTKPFYLKDDGPTDSLSGGQINFNGHHPFGKGKSGEFLERTSPCGSHARAVNKFGLWDMQGNVCEWCEDYYSNAFYSGGHGADPLCKDEDANFKNRRVIRGGSWYLDAGSCRAASRDSYQANRKMNQIGFRVCCVPVGEK